MLCVVTEQNVSMGRPVGGWGALTGGKGTKRGKKQTKKKGE